MKIVWNLIASISLGAALMAQPAYSYLDIGLQGSVNINNNRFHEFWQVQPVREIYAATPINFGFIKTGVSTHEYPGSPEYEAYFPYLGWGFIIPQSQLFAWINMIKIGNYLMQFGDYETNETKVDESELGLALSTGLEVRVYKQVYFQTSLDYFRVYTRRSIELTYISAGLCYRLETPNWFREFFK
jgi:hypothetical protein